MVKISVCDFCLDEDKKLVLASWSRGKGRVNKISFCKAHQPKAVEARKENRDMINHYNEVQIPILDNLMA